MLRMMTWKICYIMVLISLMFYGMSWCQSSTTATTTEGVHSGNNTGALRLQGGPDSYEGQVEIWFDNQWTPICREGWDLLDAHVACQQLGFKEASEAVSGNAYAAGSGSNNSFWISMDCEGSEGSLMDCSYVVSDARCEETAAVICASDIQIRLVDGEDVYSGRLEILYRDQWGTVCRDDWDDMDAAVVCMMLGAPGVQSSRTFYGTGNGPIWMDNVMCDGDEESIADCKFPGWGKHDCSHQHDVGLSCRDVRLVGGTSSLEGRVDVHHDGSWGSVCDNHWDIQDANIICRQLGFKSAFKATGAAAFGEGTGDIFLDDVQCTDTESTVQECYHRGWGQHVCEHSQDAGVICDEVRLVGGGGDYEGRLEVFHDSEWGTVCNDHWDFHDARIVCQQLGYEDALEANAGVDRFGEGTGPIWLDEVACNGDEDRLTECGRNNWGETDCNHSEDVGIICVTGPTLRLERGSPSAGRVEVFYEGTWGTVCDFQWDIADAVVACQYLGYPGASWAASGGNYGMGSGPVWMSAVQCSGEEWRLQDCPQSQPWGDNDCDHARDAGVVCVPVIPDTEPPEITDCPADITTTVETYSSIEVAVSWRQPIATDNSGEIPSVTASPPPGTEFPIGRTTVTYTFTDSTGNMAECSFDVIIEELPTTTSRPTTTRMKTTTEIPQETTTFMTSSYATSMITTGNTAGTGASTLDTRILIYYIIVPMVLTTVLLVVLVATAVACFCRRKSDDADKSKTESQRGLYLAADIPSPTTLEFMQMAPYSISQKATMEGRQLPSQPHLYDRDPPDAEGGDHEYDDADSGHYEALPPLRDENGYLVIYDDAPRIYDDPPQDREEYLVPDKRLSATQDNLVVYSQRPNTPEDSPMVISFQNAGYESSLVRIVATQQAHQVQAQVHTQAEIENKGRKYSKEKKKGNFKFKEKHDSKKHPSLKRTLTA